MAGEHLDKRSVRRASRERWPKLIVAGVELFEYEPTMIHTKLMIADGEFVSIGSANFDPRSLAINDEANLNALTRNWRPISPAIFRGASSGKNEWKLETRG